MTFGQKLKMHRQSVCKSQKQIEAGIGISQTTLSGWENDRSEPGVTELMILANFLGVTVNNLLPHD